MAKTPRKLPSGNGTKRSTPRSSADARRREALSEVLVQQREIFEQLGLCNRLLGELPELNLLDENKRTDAQATILLWHETLVLAARRNTSLVRRTLVDIPDEPDAAKRALAFWPIIVACVNALDSSPSDNTKRFLLHVAWHEGDKLRTRIQYGNGPARSFFQFEAYREGSVAICSPGRIRRQARSNVWQDQERTEERRRRAAGL
ncbi:hypothetical protein HFN53_04765 [Rhizobium leguminosarum]|nr:hypothetical protein [Rhizobium leguminosarum]